MGEGPDQLAYEVLKALASEQLGAGLSVIIDAVNPFHFVRHAYFEIAAAHAASVVVIVTSCSDTALHRRRVEERRGAGLKGTDWGEVLRQMDYYEPFEGDALRLDAVQPSDENVRAAALTSSRPEDCELIRPADGRAVH